MKTVFCRDKAELRDQLLGGMMMGRKKSRKKSYQQNQTTQAYQSKEKQKPIINLQQQQHPKHSQKQSHPRIKLKLKKHPQPSYTQPSPQQQFPSSQQSQISKNIKKLIQKQLLSTFYKNTSKVIDNRKTTYDQEMNESSQVIGDKSNNSWNNNNNVSRDTSQSRKIKHNMRYKTEVYENSVYLVKDNNYHNDHPQLKRHRIKTTTHNNQSFNPNLTLTSSANLQPHHQSLSLEKQPTLLQLQKSKNTPKFIPENQVYIPKSFITFTVKRKQKQQRESIKTQKQEDDRQSVDQDGHFHRETVNFSLSNSQVDRTSKERYQAEEVNSILEKDSQIIQREIKMAFYNRHHHQTPSSNSQQHLVLNNKPKPKAQKASSIKLNANNSLRNKISTEPNAYKEKEEKNQQVDNDKTKDWTQVVDVFKAKTIQQNPFHKNKFTYLQNQSQQILINKLQQKKPQTNPTQSNHPHHPSSHLTTPQLSLKSSLNYSTPLPKTVQQSTINKLSSISMHPEIELQLEDHSLSQGLIALSGKEVLLNDGKRISPKKNDILVKSITNFREYEKKKEEFDKQKGKLEKEQKNIKEQKDIKENQQKNLISQTEENSGFEDIFITLDHHNSKGITDKLPKLLQKSLNFKSQPSLSQLPSTETIKPSIQNAFQTTKPQPSKSQSQPISLHSIKSIKLQQNIQSEKSLTIDHLPKHQAKTQINQTLKGNSNESHAESIKEIKTLVDDQQKSKQQIISKVEIQQEEENEESGVSDFSSISEQIEQHQSQKDNSQIFPKTIQKQTNKIPIINQIEINQSISSTQQKHNYNSQHISDPKLPQTIAQKPQLHEISLDELDDYYFDEGKIIEKPIDQRDLVRFDQLPDWKYGDKRELNHQYQKELAKSQNQLQTRTYDLRQKKLDVAMNPPIQPLVTNIPITINKNITLPIKPKQILTEPKQQPLPSKVRVINPVQLSESSISEQHHEQEENNQHIGQRKSKEEQQQDELQSHRYYSSSDQQSQNKSQKSSSNSKTSNKPSSHKHPKQSTLKSTSNSRVKLIQPPQTDPFQQPTPLPLGIARPAHKKQLFPVQQQPEEWHNGSKSVSEIDAVGIGSCRNSVKESISVGNDRSAVHEIEESVLFDEGTKSLKSYVPSSKDEQEKSNDSESKQQSHDDHEMKLLEDQFRIKPKHSSSQNDHPSQKLSNFTESRHDLSDFTDEESVHEVHEKIQIKKVIGDQALFQAYTDQAIKNRQQQHDQLNNINNERAYITDLKNHIQTLLKKVSSSSSISSRTIEQPSIKPISMSSQSQQSRESIVEEYEAGHLEERIPQDEMIKKESFKKVKKREAIQSQEPVESHPLFDFSDKSVSESQQNLPTLQKHPSQSQPSITSSSKSLIISPTPQIKHEVLKEFDELFKKQSRVEKKESFEKRGHKYLSSKDLDESEEEFVPVLRPDHIEREISKGNRNNRIKRQKVQQERNPRESTENYFQSGSSGQHVTHQQLTIVPQSLYVTSAKNTSSKSIKQPVSQIHFQKDHSKPKKGLSISKKPESTIQSDKSPTSYEPNYHMKKQSNGSDTYNNESADEGSGFSQGDQNRENNRNQTNSLWSFIMKK